MKNKNTGTKSSDFYLEHPVGQILFFITVVIFFCAMAVVTTGVFLIDWIFSLFNYEEDA